MSNEKMIADLRDLRSRMGVCRDGDLLERVLASLPQASQLDAAIVEAAVEWFNTRRETGYRGAEASNKLLDAVHKKLSAQADPVEEIEDLINRNRIAEPIDLKAELAKRGLKVVRDV